ncbi:unnamed protein product [Prunus brigantina]
MNAHPLELGLLGSISFKFSYNPISMSNRIKPTGFVACANLTAWCSGPRGCA